jgi:hypothetical protein
MTYWRGPWHHQAESAGDQLTVAFFDQLFPGQSQGPGLEERYLCPSPWGDTFDVLVVGAETKAWPAYRVLLAVGEIPWTASDLVDLQAYVVGGGALVLHELNLPGWDRAFLGLEAHDLRTTPEAEVLLWGADGTPRLTRCRRAAGQVLVAAHAPPPEAFPVELLETLAAAHLPLRPDPRVQTLINRTADGWLILLAHHAGWTKEPTEPAVADPAAAVCLRLSLPSGEAAQRDPVADEPWQPLPPDDEGTVRVRLEPGQMRVLRVQA